MPHRNVIEQNQVLVDLAHIANMWHYRQPKLPRHQADRKELRDSCNAGAIYLYKMNCACLHEILEQDAIWNVLAQRDRSGRDCLRQRPVRLDIIRVSWLLDEIR